MRKQYDIVNGVPLHERLPICWKAMEQAALEGHELPLRSRRRAFVLLRGMVFLRLRDEGYSGLGVAKALGYNHTTVYNARQDAQFVVDHPTWFPDDADTWQRFTKLLGDDV
jgi:hypothetical protein